MVEYIIKSTFSLAILFGFYYMFLRNEKIPYFNRFYMLISLFFSLIIPLIKIRTTIYTVISANMQGLSSSLELQSQSSEFIESTIQIFTLQNIFVILYIVISATFFTRFVVNLYKIIKTIQISRRVKGTNNVVLVDEETLPYSFLNYVFINRSDFENDKIERELIIHENSHCNQYHTIDILLIELVKVVLWFNPIVWMYKKEIQLNHEILADNTVLQKINLNDYQKIILNQVSWNNQSQMTSNFNSSLIKKRLTMMAKSRSNRIGYKIALIPLLTLIIIYFVSCSNEQMDTDISEQQGSELESGSTNQQNSEQWWMPILAKHNVERRASNNFGNIFEMGTTNSITDGIVTLENAFFLIKGSEDEYMIIKSELGYHDLNESIIEVKKGTIETFSFKSNDTKPIETFAFKGLKYQFKEDADYMTLQKF